MPTIKELRSAAQNNNNRGRVDFNNGQSVYFNGQDAYVLVTELGNGSDGIIYKAERYNLASGEKVGDYTGKLFTNEGTLRQPGKMQNEADSASRYFGQNNVFYHNPANSQERMIFTPLARGNRLDRYIGQPQASQQNSEIAAINSLNRGSSVMRELAAVHSKGLIHSDINERNIFYDEQTKKATLIDFGNTVSTRSANELVQLKGANRNYNLDQLQQQNGNKISQKDDVYAMANVLNNTGVVAAVNNLGPAYNEPKQKMNALITAMQNPDRTKRPTAEQAQNLLTNIQSQVQTIHQAGPQQAAPVQQQRAPAGPGYQQPLEQIQEQIREILQPTHPSPLRREAVYPPPQQQPRPTSPLTKGVTLTAQSPISYSRETLTKISRDLSNDKASVGFNKSADGKTITLSVIHNNPIKIDKYDIQIDGSTLSTSKTGAKNLYVLSAMSRLANNKISGANIHNESISNDFLAAILRINRENPGKLDINRIMTTPPSNNSPPRP